MKVMTVGRVERIPLKEARLTIHMRATKGEDYTYTGWFAIYPLVKYDIILGMDWMEEVEHCVNYQKKRLRIGPKGGKAKSVIQGLTAQEAEQFVESRVDRQPVTLKSMSLDTDPCDDMEVMVAEIVSEEEYQSDCAAIWMELSNAETSPDLKEFEKWIRKKYPDLFEEPTGLPPERKSGGFRIRLIPGAQPPHISPYRMTPTELKGRSSPYVIGVRYDDQGHPTLRQRSLCRSQVR
jgi:hypothetical protein